MKLDITTEQFEKIFWQVARQHNPFSDDDFMSSLLERIMSTLIKYHGEPQTEAEITGLDSNGNVIDRTEYETVHVLPGMTREEISAALQKKSTPARRKVPGIPQQLVVIDY